MAAAEETTSDWIITGKRKLWRESEEWKKKKKRIIGISPPFPPFALPFFFSQDASIGQAQVDVDNASHAG